MASYVTTPIYYVNDRPHIGHAYTSLAADTLARWWRLCGEDARMLTGTDEHGQKIEQAAEKAGITPQAHADLFAERFQALCPVLDLSNDDFIRTTQPRHQRVVQQIWQRMEAAGDIYLDAYEGWYSVGDEAYFTEQELVDGKAPSGHEVKWVVEPSYFFRLSKYSDWLLEYLQANPEFVRPRSRYNEILRFVEGGLRDISISRTTFSWGVPVPGAEGHVMYVWVDALTNYISALGGPDDALFERYWPNAVHLIGKDILRFHAVYWPCFLKSAGLALPRQIFAHGWWTREGQKMSKSFGNVVDPFEMVEKYGADIFRFFLLREVSFGSDGDFSEAALRSRANGELAKDYGNLLNRAVGMVGRYRAGLVPTAKGPNTELELRLLEVYATARASLEQQMEKLAFNKAISAIWQFVNACNKYIQDVQPWAIAKTDDAARLDTVLYTICEAIRVLGVWTLPFLPQKANELLDRLNVPPALRDFASTAAFGGLVGGQALLTGEALFPQIEAEAEAAATPKAVAQKKGQDKAQSKGAKKKQRPPKAVDDGTVQFDDFKKLELRVARIVAAERHPDADRLLKLTVDAGEPELRTICAGIANAYSPEELVGQTAVLLANLKPRKIRGVLSQGMLLAAGEGAATRLATVPGDLAPGSRIS